MPRAEKPTAGEDAGRLYTGGLKDDLREIRALHHVLTDALVPAGVGGIVGADAERIDDGFDV